MRQPWKITGRKGIQATALVAFFILCQLLALNHAAANNFDDHTHNGQICSLSALNERGEDLNIPTAIAEFSRPFFSEANVVGTVFVPLSTQASCFKARAPPTS
jgi:hypothetical protein